jgi:heat shock protein HslJ
MNKQLWIVLSLVLTSALLLSACSSGNELAGSSWSLVSYGNLHSLTSAASGVDTALNFSNDGTVGGSMGCNSFGGDVSVKGDKITFDSLFQTEMACEEPRMTQESTTLGIMNSASSFAVDGDTLTITSSTGEAVIVLARK